MTKRLSLILMLLLIGFMSEAKVTSTKDEVNVASVQAGIQNAVEPASEFVTIAGPFQIDTGAEFSIAMQKCPE